MWISKDDPVYQHLRAVPPGVRRPAHLIVALQSDRLFTPEALEFIRQVTGDIERVDTVERVQSLATANIVRSLPAGPDGDDGGIEVQPLLDESIDEAAAAAARRTRCSDDPLLRGDLVSEDGTVTAIVVTFDEDRIDDVRAGVIERDPRSSIDPRLPAGMQRVLQRQPRDQRDLQPRHARRTRRNLTPPILAADGRRHLRDVPLVAHHRAADRRGARQRRLDDGPVRADGVHLQRARQHAAAAGDDPGHRRRRAHRAALQPRAARDRRARSTRSSRACSTCSRRCSAPAARPRSACCRSPPATSSPCARSASARPSA